ncbi:MAG TPA: hypothetical protein VF755_28205, partial [Catenuloplanes sp.]
MSPVAEPLTVADLAALDAAYLHRWRYRWPRFVALSGGMVLALLTLIAFTADARPCLPESPCGPDRAGSILLGVMYGVALLSLIYRRWAAAAAVTIAAVLPWYDHSQPDIALALWLYLLAGAHVIGCLVLARIADPRWHPAVRRWRAGRTDLRTPAKPARRMRPPFGHAWAGVGLLAGALAGARWIEVHQARVGRQEAIA